MGTQSSLSLVAVQILWSPLFTQKNSFSKKMKSVLMIALLAAFLFAYVSETSAMTDAYHTYGWNHLRMDYGNGYYKPMPKHYAYQYQAGYGPAAYLSRFY